MTQWPPPDLYVEAKLLGILLSGLLGQTRNESGAEKRSRPELRQSGTYRATPDPTNDSER